VILALEQLVRQVPRALVAARVRRSRSRPSWPSLAARTDFPECPIRRSSPHLFPLCPWGCSNDDALRNVQTGRALVTVDLLAVPVYPDPNRTNSGGRVGQARLRK
jgi:hypothetical protein